MAHILYKAVIIHKPPLIIHTTYNCRIPIEIWPTPGDPDSQDVHNPNGD